MGLKDRLNPLGQRIPSDKVGETNDRFKHGQSAELVEAVRRKAAQAKNKNPRKTDKKAAPGEYDISGPDRQPGKIARQSKLGKQPRQNQEGQYTQDNEEEGPVV